MRSSAWLVGMLVVVGGCGRREPAATHAAADAARAPPPHPSGATPLPSGASAVGAEPTPRVDTTPHTGFAPATAPDAARPRIAARAARADETIRVPAGGYRLGSTPGDVGRDPAVEADGVPVQVPAFDIDALPYPNDPAQQTRTGATREEAANLCRQHNRRLCTEVEWERACSGPAETLFPNGDTWDATTCAGRGDPGECASGFGALVMGARSAEWTADDLDQRAVIRGGPADAAAPLHRCAARRTAVANQPGLEIAFRCCGGPAPQVAYPREISRPPFREETMSAAQLAPILATIPELSRERDGLGVFSPSAVAEVFNHGSTTADQHPEVTLTASPLHWSPTFGEELLVVSAISTVGSFIAALWVLPSLDGHTPRYRHAASFILAGDRVSIALGYSRGTREELQWHACFNCPGEFGVVHYSREDAHVVITQR